ncbi:RICIN domain-containing protein [Micromonospora sp. NPDC004704]
MMPDDHLDDALRSLAAHAGRTGRLPNVPADVRQRGDKRRKRRYAGSAALGVALVGLLTAGIAVTQPNRGPQTGPPAAPPASAGPSTPPSATPTPTPSPAPPTTPAGTADPLLSGTREVTMVRVQASEGAVALDDGLMEVDDDSGRQRFVTKPLGGDLYQVLSYTRANNHPAADEPSCWQVYNPNSGRSLTVEGALCDPDNPAQRFTITAQGKGAYAISNQGAFLQFSPTKGLIMEELGDAPLLSTFRFVDVGPARTPAGG